MDTGAVERPRVRATSSRPSSNPLMAAGKVQGSRGLDPVRSDFMSEVRVVVIDDDHWKRTAIAQELEADKRIGLEAVIDQDEALRWHEDRWGGVDLAIVDIFDEQAPGEIGTDVFSGIAALDRLRDLPIKTFAITPHCQHPLIQLRINQAQPNWLYHRWEVNDPERLIQAILNPAEDHVLRRPSEDILGQYGVVRLRDGRLARTNESVRVYKRSALLGHLRPDLEIEDLPISRRRVETFRIKIARTGFMGTHNRSTATRNVRGPRWPDVRDYLLTLLGRRATPPTEVDRDEEELTHGGIFKRQPPATP